MGIRALEREAIKTPSVAASRDTSLGREATRISSTAKRFPGPLSPEASRANRVGAVRRTQKIRFTVRSPFLLFPSLYITNEGAIFQPAFEKNFKFFQKIFLKPGKSPLRPAGERENARETTEKKTPSVSLREPTGPAGSPERSGGPPRDSGPREGGYKDSFHRV